MEMGRGFGPPGVGTFRPFCGGHQADPPVGDPKNFDLGHNRGHLGNTFLWGVLEPPYLGGDTSGQRTTPRHGPSGAAENGPKNPKV